MKKNKSLNDQNKKLHGKKVLNMKRFVLILKILLPLFLLVALTSVGCSTTSAVVSVSWDKVMVGEQVELSVLIEYDSPLGCEYKKPEKMAGNLYAWSVEPSDGATVKGGVFVASKPGKYTIAPTKGPKYFMVAPCYITVEGTAVETTAAEITITETTTAITTKPSETSTEPEETSAESETTSTETNANLIHGVVPTKVTAHLISNSNEDFYFEFWNVGKLGGEQYAKLTITGVTIIYEGYFTGGPNGDMYFTGEAEGQSFNGHAKLEGGKTIIPDDEESSIPIDNPGAFDGWVD